MVCPFLYPLLLLLPTLELHLASIPTWIHIHNTHNLAHSDWLLFAEPPKFSPNQFFQSSSFLMQTHLATLSINTKIFCCLDYTVRMTNTCSSKKGGNQKYLCVYLFKQGLAIILLGGLAGQRLLSTMAWQLSFRAWHNMEDPYTHQKLLALYLTLFGECL